MAGDVTRNEFDDLEVRVDILEGQEQPPVPPVAPGPVTMAAPTIVVDGDRYTITATATAIEDVTLKFLQIAVRGAGAKDLALSPGTTLRTGAPLTLKGTARGAAGAFSACLAYALDGGEWVEGPPATFAIATSPVGAVGPVIVVTKPPAVIKPPVGAPPVAGGRKIALVKRSGLPFNSLVFRQTPTEADEFGKRRGVPVDGFLTFQGRQTWNDLRWGVDRGYREWLEAGRLIVLSIPHAPEAEGDAMNSRGANNAYKSQQRDLGAFYAAQGLNSVAFVLRLDWEFNGSWYHWSANRPGGPAALRQALGYAVDNLRAGGLTKARFDLCANKGPSQAGAAFEAVFPGADKFDIVGIDQYDMWAPSYQDSDWEREMNKPPSIRSTAAFAKKHGIQWMIDECGNTHGGSNQGGDNPFYWEMLRKEIDRELESCAGHVTYDHAGAPNTLRHDFDSNPESFGAYKRLWRPR